jgi:hypothetical protein
VGGELPPEEMPAYLVLRDHPLGVGEDGPTIVT